MNTCDSFASKANQNESEWKIKWFAEGNKKKDFDSRGESFLWFWCTLANKKFANQSSQFSSSPRLSILEFYFFSRSILCYLIFSSEYFYCERRTLGRLPFVVFNFCWNFEKPGPFWNSPHFYQRIFLTLKLRENDDPYSSLNWIWIFHYWKYDLPVLYNII